MGNKTVKRLAILIAIIALLGGGGYMLWAFQVDRMAHGVVARAERAEKAGKYDEAGRLYQEHLAVVPGDIEVQLKYAEVLAKQEKRRQEEALATFEDVVKRYPSRVDVRRRAAEVAFDLGAISKARDHLAILLKTARDDAHLQYLMGRCYEREEDFAHAVECYDVAIQRAGPGADEEPFDAALRRAILLRDKLGDEKEADRVINAMVASAPESSSYLARLGRGRYREFVGGKGGEESRKMRRAAVGAGVEAVVFSGIADFLKAMELAPPDRPAVYLEVARAVEREAGLDAARPYLDRGLAAAPKSVEMYQALAGLEQRAGRVDEAIKAMELGLKALPDELNLRWQLAMLLAGQGEKESGRLLLQIAEMERLGASPPFTRYLTAYYHFNKGEFGKAEQILAPLKIDVARIPNMKAVVNLLLYRCGVARGEADPQALEQAVSNNPDDPTVRANWIQELINRGDLDGALREYRSLSRQQPGVVQSPLAALLIELLIQREAGGRRPEASDRWGEIEGLVAQAERAAPEALGPKLLRVRLLMAQAQEARARDAIATLRGRFPKDPRTWTVEAELLIGQAGRDEKKLDEARDLLGRAEKELGDRVELRLARMSLILARRGPQVVPALNELGRGLEAFAPGDRRRLLRALAVALGRQQDLKGAAEAWAKLAREEPENLQPRLQLFDLALQSGDEAQAEARAREAGELDPQYGALCRAQLLAWRARRAAEPADREKARGEARGLLTELRTRRPDWSVIPLVLAGLDEEEAGEAGADKDRGQEKLDAAIASYRGAIELGQRDPAVMRKYIQLLFRAGRGSEALDFYSQAQAGMGRLTAELGQVAQVALRNREYEQAEEIARKAVDANPDDFQARVRLAQVLLEARRADQVEDVLRKGVDAARNDPDRWIVLVQFLVLARRYDRAERAAREAEAQLAATAPVAVAQCCGIMGKAFELSEPDRCKPWYAQARAYFARAQQALKDPADLSVKRRLAEFLLQTNEAADAEGPLKEIVAGTADGKSPALSKWARRGLARIYAAANPPRIAEALALFGGKSGQGDDPDDLRVMSLIHEVQRTPDGRRQAIAALEALIAREPARATSEDRRRLAQLLEQAGEWPRAREQLRELVLRADDAPDQETQSRRPLYIALLIEGLLRHHQPGDDSDLDEARRLVEKFRSVRRDPLLTLLLDVQIDRAAKNPDAALKRVRDYAGRSDVDTAGRLRLATELERLGIHDGAEWAYRRVADEKSPDRRGLPNRLALALFLAHRPGRLKEAVDLCEQLWADPATREITAAVCVPMLCNPASPVDVAQTRRVIGWYEQAAAADPRSANNLLGLGTLYERIDDYSRAEDAYRKAIQIKDSEGIAANNLAWLIALRGGPANEALALSNAAIKARGAMPEYLDTRGMIYLYANQPRRAVTDLEAAFRSAPTPPKYFHLAQAYLKINDREKARKTLEAGKSRGLPGGLHPLEVDAYKKIAGELGLP